MENQHVLDTYYYKFPSQEEQHQRENQRNCRSGLPRIGNVIMNALNTPEYESQVRIEKVLRAMRTYRRYHFKNYLICTSKI